MAMYKHICVRCALAIDLVCKIDARDDPKPCADFVTLGMRNAPAGKITVTPPRGTEVVLGASNPYAACDGTGTLKRPADEVEVTGATPYAWRP